MPLPNFNRLAPIYRWMELLSFGPWLMICRCAFLKRCLTARRALVLGDGDGRFTAKLLKQNATIRIDAIDASSAMLRSLRLRSVPHAVRVCTWRADARSLLPPDPPYDLIVSHFFLDCLSTEEVRSLAAVVAGAVSPRSLWIVSEFAIPPTRFGRFAARPIVWALYRAFGWLTGLEVRSLPDHHSALGEAGFSLESSRTWLSGLLVSELWSAPTANQIFRPLREAENEGARSERPLPRQIPKI